MRFELGRYTETQRTKRQSIAHRTAIERRNLQNYKNSFLFSRLQIEMRRQVEKPTLALIETSAHPKRCGFGLSRTKSLKAENL
jgi:hypothetical protein